LEGEPIECRDGIQSASLLGPGKSDAGRRTNA